MFDESGFACLGAEEKKGFDVVSVLKKEGPNVLSAVSDELKKKDAPKDIPADKKAEMVDKARKKSEGSWFTRPVLGPIPGGGVLAIGAGVVGLGGLVVKKLFF